MRILYPADYFNKKIPDELYLNESKSFKNKGLSFSTINTDQFCTKKTYPALKEEETVLYRGWMLDKTQYQELLDIFTSYHAKAFTSYEQYLAAHHLPNWYPKIKEYTPKTYIFTDYSNLETELKNIGWKEFFIKDYVKSLKTSLGSKITKASDIHLILSKMKDFRGKIEGGICVREVEDFKTKTEQRFFVINNKAFSNDRKQGIPDIVKNCAKKIKSPFFSVDYIKTVKNEERIVEIGDGQVSDLVGWDAPRFVEIWQDTLTK